MNADISKADAPRPPANAKEEDRARLFQTDTGHSAELLQ